MNLDLNLGRLDLDPVHCQPFLRYYNEHPQMDKKLINFLKFYLHMSKHDQIKNYFIQKNNTTTTTYYEQH